MEFMYSYAQPFGEYRLDVISRANGISSNSYGPPTMTVTVSSERRADALAAQRWGSPRQVTLKRSPGAPLGVSIVGGKVGSTASTVREEYNND